jgi:hypothetical protein
MAMIETEYAFRHEKYAQTVKLGLRSPLFDEYSGISLFTPPRIQNGSPKKIKRLRKFSSFSSLHKLERTFSEDIRLQKSLMGLFRLHPSM